MANAKKTIGRKGAWAGAVTMAVVGAAWLGPFPPDASTMALAQSESAGDTFKIDAGHSAAIYRIKHFGAAYNYGRFNGIEGTFMLDPNNPEASKIRVTIDTASVDSGNEKRDDHLRNPDFFSAKQFPTATFNSTSVRKTGGSAYEVTGEFTLRGTTKPMTVTLNHTGEGPDPWGGYRSGVETVFTFKRSDFGVSWGLDNGALGDDVRMIIALEGIRE